MADALMNWDATQKRWRKRYKGVMLRIKASDLGGTNATDTLIPSNAWYKEQRSRIDRERAVTSYRPHELEYLAELENIRAAMKSLALAVRIDPDTEPMLAPKIALLKQKGSLINEVLQKTAPLPPLDDTLRNPIYISPDSLEDEVRQEVLQFLNSKGYIRVSKGDLRRTEGYVRNAPQRLGLGVEDSMDAEDNTVFYKRMAILRNVNEHHKKLEADIIAQRQAEVVGLKDEVLARKKQELGFIDNEYDRGVINQLLKEQGIEIAESRKLAYHLGKFMAIQRRKCAEKKIGVGRLESIIYAMGFYQKWSPILDGNEEKIGTKEHIDAYYNHLSDRVLANEYKPRYVKGLFAEFKRLIGWLYEEEILKEKPRCLELKNKKYVFRIERETAKVVPLKWVHRILNTAAPHLKLFVLLTLNCGFGASEIGKLTKEEYDPTEGRIRHKRCKTEESPNVPTVCYKLWTETKELLDQEIAKCKNYPKRPESVDHLLVHRDGGVLWHEYVSDDGKTHKSDKITIAFNGLIERLRKDDPEFPPVSYYQFRKTSASYIRNEHQFRTYNGLWLGHAPETMGDQHYNAMDDTILDACVNWLHRKIFGFLSLPGRENC